VGKYYTHTHTHTHTHKQNHVDFKYVYLQKKIMGKKKSSRYHYCSNVWNSENSNAFSIKFIFLLNFFHRCVDLGIKFKNKIYLFSFEQSMKKIIMVKVGYFYMWQRMMWDNVVILSHILCQQVQLWKLYN
jgi:hypothetical protein